MGRLPAGAPWPTIHSSKQFNQRECADGCRGRYRPTAEGRRIRVQHQNEAVYMADVALRDERGGGGRPHPRAQGHGESDVRTSAQEVAPKEKAPPAWSAGGKGHLTNRVCSWRL